jgi:hypothetical protein
MIAFKDAHEQVGSEKREDVSMNTLEDAQET